MAQQDDPQEHSYPTGRGYGHDYMRGGELLGGYGYSARPDYQRRRGERVDDGGDRHGDDRHDDHADGRGDDHDTSSAQQRPRRQATASPDERPLNAS